MTVSLSYDFSLFEFEDNSHVNIFGYKSAFEFTKNMYVFTIISISYLMYSHDLSYEFEDIEFHDRTKGDQLVEKFKLTHFPNSES
jgi:hypothetical protein